uniref:Fe2OG dioxygenase domain-containing protein n=1 Tax=Kalanchoe fedtschenkoi TaxID=63787 RepID=A0A7N0RHL3_KALFE
MNLIESITFPKCSPPLPATLTNIIKMAREGVAGSTYTYDRLKELKEFDESKIGCKGLADSGITTIPRIFHHPPETVPKMDRSAESPAASLAEIPVIDLSDLESPTRRRLVVDQVRLAASTWGFFQVVSHGISASVMERTSAAIKAFHEQPHQEKIKHYKRDEMNGFIYSTNNDLYRSKAANWHDHIQLWTGPTPPVASDIPDICRDEIIQWDREATKVADLVLELLAEGLGLDSKKFKEMGCTDCKALVGTCYPYCPEPERTMGIAAHSDGQVLTVLMTNQVAGLQVKHGDDWIDVKPCRGGLIINIGDLLQAISNGVYRSVEHRVFANYSRELRISVVMFFNLLNWREGDMMGPLPELLSQDSPAIYRDFTKQEYLDKFLSNGYDSKSLLDFIRI